MAQHPGRQVLSLGPVAGAHPDPREIRLSEAGLDAPHPVVRAGSAVPAHPHLSGRQVDIVIDHQHLFLRHLEARQQPPYALPAPVHEGLRLAQHDFRFAVRHFRRHPLQQQSPAQLHAVMLLQPAYHFKTRVMAGMGILFPRVSQADDQNGSLSHNLFLPQSRSAQPALLPLQPAACLD